MVNTIECAGFLENSCDDGPGVRSVLFLQGCNKNCKGCHNSRIKEHGKGITMKIENVVNYIDLHCCNKKITISGGEPLEQIDGLSVLVETLKKRGYNICVYTGWKLNMVPERFLKLLDYIKTGEFVASLKNSNIQYVGSTNQHMFMIDNGNIKEISLVVQGV